MTPKEKGGGQESARMLLQTLKEAKLVLDWRKNNAPVLTFTRQSRRVLDELSPSLHARTVPAEVRHRVPARL